MINLLPIILVLLVALIIIIFLKSNKQQKVNKIITNELNAATTAKIQAEKELFHLEKNVTEYENAKLNYEEKNKKIWLMNEQVYIEKKKVDEQNENLITEKNKLETEKKKVEERVKKLWLQSTAIHTEKEKINILKLEIEEKHQSIKDSIDYARVIQLAILPPLTEIQQIFPNSFVFFNPRDVVSGDFYWFASLNEKECIIAAADCTGHGVPGAFMSMIGNTLLNEIVNDKKIHAPDEILNTLNTSIRAALKQDDEGSETRDGMDIAICKYNSETRLLTYSGANRPLYLVQNYENEIGILQEIKANKFPIGGIRMEFEKVFTAHEFQLKTNDCFYIFSDGYADQFGGPRGKKFMTPNFQKLLCQSATENMNVQHQKVEFAFNKWKGNLEQVDDVLVIGVKV